MLLAPPVTKLPLFYIPHQFSSDQYQYKLSMQKAYFIIVNIRQLNGPSILY